MQELERQFLILLQVNGQISPPVSPLSESDSDTRLESRQPTPKKDMVGLESQSDQVNVTYRGELKQLLQGPPAYEEQSSVSSLTVSPESIPSTDVLPRNRAEFPGNVSPATVALTAVPLVTLLPGSVSPESVSPESVLSSDEMLTHKARLSASTSSENAASTRELPTTRIAVNKPKEFQISADSMLSHPHPYIPGCFWPKHQNPAYSPADDEFQDEMHHMNPVLPAIPRYKSNRLSVLSMASSIAMMAPFIRSQSNGDSTTSPSDYYVAKDTQQIGSGYNDTIAKVCKWPHKGSSDKEKNSNINRLSVLMQRAIINGKKKRNQGITEQTIEEWSSSLESCFDIPEHSISLDFPEGQHSVPTAGVSAQSNKGYKKFSTVTSRTKKSINSWGRKSRMWFTSSKDQSSSGYQFNDDCSLVTVPDQTTERVYYATASHRLSQATINREISLNTAAATVAHRKSYMWNSVGWSSSHNTTAKPDRKQGKITRFFKSLLPSQTV